MKTEGANIFYEEEFDCPEPSNLQLETDKIEIPFPRKELLSILIRSELELAYIFTTDVLQCTHVLKKIIRKLLKKQKKVEKIRKTSFTSET